MLARSPPQTSVFKRVLDALNPKPPAARHFTEMGVGGTAIHGGYIQTREKSAQWVGQQRYVTISDMAVNTSIIAAGIHYFLNLIARPTWTVAPKDEKSSEAKAAAEFVDEVLHDLSGPWSRVVRRAGTYRFYGFGVQEWTAKRRLDGKVGLESIEPRPQSTIARWSVSDSGAVEGVWQVAPQTGKELGIPRKKLLYLVDDVLSDSPEGVGIFRHLAEPWERLKQYYALEARAFERDLRGTPVGRVPYTLLREAVANNDLTEAQAREMSEVMENFVKLQVKQSDTAITIDSIPYYSQAADGAKAAGMPQWGLELLSGGAAGMGEVAAAITRTQTEMARILTVEHLMMGESSGNRSLGEDKSKNLYLVANAVLQDIAAGVQQDIIPAICILNGIPEELYPECEVEDVSSADAAAVAAVLAQMAQAGAVLAPDDDVVDDVRQLLGVSISKPPTPEMMGLVPPAGDEPGKKPAVAEDEEELDDDDEEIDVEKHGDHDQSTHGHGGGGGGEPPRAGQKISFSTKAEAFSHKRAAEAGGFKAKVFRTEQNITAASRGSYAAHVGGQQGANKVVTYSVHVLPGDGIKKYNPNHDERGRFASGGADGGGAGAASGAAGVSSNGAAAALLAKNADPSATMESIMSGLSPQQREMMDAARAATAAGTSTRDQFRRADGTYTPEREALHEEILTKMFTPEVVAAATPIGMRPELVLTGGRPAAGKTSALRAGGIDAGPPKSVYLSADVIQESLPGYSGDRAGLYNPEAQDIADKAESMAMALGVNLVFDATMKTGKSALDRVHKFSKAGYDVSGYFVHTAPEVSAKRSVERFASSGRFVPPEVSFNSRSNEATFDALTPFLTKWALFDNNGTKPRVVARSGK